MEEMETESGRNLANTLIFANPFPPSSFKLIEVSKEIASKIKNNEPLIVRGLADDYVSFCTDDETFRVKDVEITNTMVVCDKIDENSIGQEVKVKYETKSYLELTKDEGTPYLALKDLLSKQQFDLPDESDGSIEWITMEDILDEVQFSRVEVEIALAKMPVVEVNGSFRYLSKKARSYLLNSLIEAVDDDSLPEINVNHITFDDLQRNFDFAIEDYCIKWIIQRYVDSSGRLNEFAVCQDRAVEVLEKEHEIPENLFKRKMMQLLPNGVEFNDEALKGIAITTESIVRGMMLDYVNVEDLPSNPQIRLNMLFKIRTAWKKDDLEPYIMDFCPTKANVMPFLLKNCQQIKEGNNQLFVKRDDEF
uniref:Sister chromatid cohesion protein DCC1 n=1 Tax=Panagrolaimus sp. JU765 TaxID=591449 RepID=A0AC34R4G7_9BILA